MSTDYISAYTALALIALLSFGVFWVWRRFCYNEDGYVFEKDWVRIGSFARPLGVKVRYDEIESVQVFGPLGAPLDVWFDADGDVSRLTANRVVIWRSQRLFFGPVLFTPKDSAVFVEQLRQRSGERGWRIEFKNC